MCLLGVSMMNNHIYGSKVPQNCHFGGLNRHFKPSMRKILIAISSDLCVRLTRNLTGSYGQQQRLHEWSRMVVKQFQDGGRQPFWKSIYHHISVKNHEILYTAADFELDERHVIKNEKQLHWTDSEFDRTYFLFNSTFLCCRSCKWPHYALDLSVLLSVRLFQTCT